MRLFKKQVTGGTPDQSEQNHGDYAVKKSKRTYMVARVLAVLAAFLLWAYVASSNSSTEERDFSLIPLTYREESNLKNEYGLIVQSINIDTLNVTLMGNRADVRKITNSDVKAYVSLSGITEEGEYPLDVYVDAPSGTTCVAQTVDKVVVSVVKPSAKTVKLSSEKVKLRGWTLDNGCYFGDIRLDTEEIVLKGSTLELEKVADIEVRTDMIGNADSSFTATGSVHLLDSDGNEIIGSGVSVQGGNHLRVSVEVLKRIKVDLKLRGKNGLLSEETATLSPSQVWLTGEPQTLAGIKDLEIGSIDETVLTEETLKRYNLSLDGVKITDEAGNEIDLIEATVRPIEKSRLEIVLTDISVWCDGETVGQVSLKLISEDNVNSEVLRLITADNVTVYLPTDADTDDVSRLIIAFDKLYLTAIDDYTLYDYEFYGSREVA